jgi:hypothetical protein
MSLCLAPLYCMYIYIFKTFSVKFYSKKIFPFFSCIEHDRLLHLLEKVGEGWKQKLSVNVRDSY